MPVSTDQNIDENTISKGLDSKLEAKTLGITSPTFSDEGSGGFAGYASVFGNVDSYGDIVQKGAYNETIGEFMKDGFIAWNHGWEAQPIATIKEAKEDQFGLWIETEFHSTDFAQNIRKIVQERLARGKSMGLSIGYVADKKNHDEKGHRLLEKVSLFEVSLVNMPANRAAQVISSKNADNFAESKAVMGVQNFSVFPDRNRGFDRPAAEARIRAWAGAKEAPNAKYASAYIWHEGTGTPDQFGQYKLPIVDIIDGKPQILAHSVFRNAVVVQGGRAGLNVPDQDKEKIRKTLSSYYAKLREAFNDENLVAPWDRAKSQFTEEEIKAYQDGLEDAEVKINTDPNVSVSLSPELSDDDITKIVGRLTETLSKNFNLTANNSEVQQINNTSNLPDSAFAFVAPGAVWKSGRSDNNHRFFLHHDLDGNTTEELLTNSLQDLFKSDLSVEEKASVKTHLMKHADENGINIEIKETGIVPDHLDDAVLTFVAEADNTLTRIESLTTRAKAVSELRAKDGRQLSASNRQKLMTVRDGLKDHAQTVDRLLQESDLKPGTDVTDTEFVHNSGNDVSEGVRKDSTIETFNNLTEMLNHISSKAVATEPDADDSGDAEDLKKILDLIEQIEDQLSAKIAEMDPNFVAEEDNDADDQKSLNALHEIAEAKIQLRAGWKNNSASSAKRAFSHIEEAKSKLETTEKPQEASAEETLALEIETLEMMTRLNGVRF